MMERKRPQSFEIYRHFKGNLYQIITLAKHSETGEELVIYQALYGTYGVCARPLSMFMSETDHEKYPDVQQKYRFEKVSEVTQEKLEEKQETEDDLQDKPNPDLIAFLDADTMKEKKQLLISMKDRITHRLIDDMAASLDVMIDEGDLDARYDNLMTCVNTIERFEVTRLR